MLGLGFSVRIWDLWVHSGDSGPPSTDQCHRAEPTPAVRGDQCLRSSSCRGGVQGTQPELQFFSFFKTVFGFLEFLTWLRLTISTPEGWSRCVRVHTLNSHGTGIKPRALHAGQVSYHLHHHPGTAPSALGHGVNLD